jgi:hypothetical protein
MRAQTLIPVGALTVGLAALGVVAAVQHNAGGGLGRPR